MEVINYLNNSTKLNMEMQSNLPTIEISSHILALEHLKDELGIKYSINELYPRLVVLNYDQIESPKFHVITQECRSLVLEIPEGTDEWKVVSRSFDRFYNYGEIDCGYNAKELVANEKMDGSLIGLFHYDGEWLYRTRSMIMPTGNVNGFDLTWKELIEEALQKGWGDGLFLNKIATYILELTSPENRVVTRYSGRKMTLLTARSIEGHYWPSNYLEDLAFMKGWNRPKIWKFETMSDCVEGAKELRELNEGYVMYNRLGDPVVKVKNPAYVAAHHLRGEGILTPKRVIDLVIMNEVDEYLSIFEEDRDQIQPYINAYDEMWGHVKALWVLYGDITDRKEFALKVKDHPVASLLFSKKSGMNFNDAFNKLLPNSKYSIISSYLPKEDS